MLPESGASAVAARMKLLDNFANRPCASVNAWTVFSDRVMDVVVCGTPGSYCLHLRTLDTARLERRGHEILATSLGFPEPTATQTTCI